MYNRSKRLEPDEDELYNTAKKSKATKALGRLYLETINLKKLDFDLEKICSVTLSHLNVYCCLVCGKYLQGRGKESVAFLHAINDDHHVFINTETLKVYVLPDNYEVNDFRYLDNIKYAIFPTFILQNGQNYSQKCYDLDNDSYISGFVPLNCVSGDSYANVIIHAIAHISPLRDYLLLKNKKDEYKDQLTQRLSVLVRRMWSPKLFRRHVSPYEFFQYLSILSKDSKILKTLHHKKDPKDFLLWIFNHVLSSDKSSDFKEAITGNCRGEVSVSSTKVEELTDESGKRLQFVEIHESKRSHISKFWTLSLDLPPKPLFADGRNVNNWPQVKLIDLMKKFDGTKQIHSSNSVRTYELTKLPSYLILHIDRFAHKMPMPVKNRNQAVVEFPLNMSIGGASYRLICNIVHKALPSRNGSQEEDKDLSSEWKIQILEPLSGDWYEFQDKSIRAKEKELLFLDESFLQVWEKIQ